MIANLGCKIFNQKEDLAVHALKIQIEELTHDDSYCHRDIAKKLGIAYSTCYSLIKELNIPSKEHIEAPTLIEVIDTPIEQPLICAADEHKEQSQELNIAPDVMHQHVVTTQNKVNHITISINDVSLRYESTLSIEQSIVQILKGMA